MKQLNDYIGYFLYLSKYEISWFLKNTSYLPLKLLSDTQRKSWLNAIRAIKVNLQKVTRCTRIVQQIKRWSLSKENGDL